MTYQLVQRRSQFLIAPTQPTQPTTHTFQDYPEEDTPRSYEMLVPIYQP